MVRTFALVVGIVFLVVGILGFIPGLTTGGGEYLLGIFAVDATHNLIHLLVGALGLAAFYWDRARLYCQVLGVVYLAVGILGFIPALVFGEKLLGIFAVNLADNLLHLVVGAFAAYLGFAPQATGRRISPTH
ncbi:DUF4383 domain-containing protein [Rubrobacter tropicus]|uniref:DUF4383 domain-containing protein n=1 Tax=Rubrobacter tropicus TaxID=2653851 RepID=A0A6G8Q4A5_9ACTN|nr:DUF4383 domain-containing protein [Rubrobacter tropicus]QIN81296.1 DUF4383 domain-containing protein [Rubrobacter tropicus]